LGPGHEGTTLKASRAYIAGLGTTGVLIGSFFLLLTVGSTLVAFRGVPGQASNGDLSRIELREQRAAAEGGPALLTARNVLDDIGGDVARGDASGSVFGQGAAQSAAAGQIEEGTTGSADPDALHPGAPGAPAEKTPSTPSPVTAPGTGVITVPVAPGTLAENGSGTGSGTGTDTGAGSGTGSGSGSDSGSGSTTDSGSGSGTTDDTGGTDTSGSGGSSGTGGSTGTGGATDVVDTVEETTGSAGAAAGAVSPGAGQAVSGTGTAAGGLLGDLVGDLADPLGS